MKASVYLALAASAALLLSGCGGLSDVDEQKQNPPLAKAVVVNHAFTPDSAPVNGTVTTTVRSGAEVVVSGKESDSDNAPIVRYEWSVAEAAGTGLADQQLIVRNNSTVSFFAPAVSKPTSLTLRLTVVDANEQTADAQVNVNVEPIQDQDRFLSFNGEPQRFFVYTKLAADTAPATVGDVSFSVKVEPLLKYLDRGGTPRENEPVGRIQEQQLTWELSTIGGSAQCGAQELMNPVLTFDIPALNVNDIRLKYQNTDRDRLLELRDIDLAELKLRISLTQLSGPDVGLDICVLSENPTSSAATQKSGSPMMVARQATDGASREIEVKVTDFLDEIRAGQESPSFDTATSAQAYYGTIDPDHTRTTLSAWFAANGFNPQAADFGADAHAVYLNNFDLGFGRDMYTKRGVCDGGVEEPGKCDVASVVFNYSSLDGAAKRISPIVAVAMEYARAAGDTSGTRFTKFYTFAPDLRGEFVRVGSVDLDGRGEKYMPQVCIVCHAGRPGPTVNGLYAENGNLDAGWLSWDLDAFKYSDTDQSFSGKPEDAELRSRYTRDAQQEQFRKLNYYTWLTLHKDGDATLERFRGARELIEGWYGGADKLAASGTTWAKYLPKSWDPGKTTGLPDDADEMYHNVFAQNCRACHVLHVPGNVDGQKSMLSYLEFIDSITTTLIGSSQLPNGLMPFARMTMDRFWLPGGDPASNESASDTLNGHLESLGENAFVTPGTPEIVIAGMPDELTKDEDAGYRLDALGSQFVSMPVSWSLSKPDGSGAALFFEETLTPVLTGIDRKGKYTVKLTPSDGSPPAEASADREDNDIKIIAPSTTDTVALAVDSAPNPVKVTWTGGEQGKLKCDPLPTTSHIQIADCTDGQITFVRPTIYMPTSVTVNFSIIDSDDQDDRDRESGSFAVLTTNVLTVNPARGYSETARTLSNGSALLSSSESVPSPLLDLGNSAVRSNPTGNPVRVELVSPPPNLSMETGTNRVRYTPEIAYMSMYRVDEPGVTMDKPVTVDFRACLVADISNNGNCPDTSPTNTLTIETVSRDPNSSWDAVYGGVNGVNGFIGIGASCNSCHVNSTKGSFYWMGQDNDSDAVFHSTCNHRTDGTYEVAMKYIVSLADPPVDGVQQSSILGLKAIGKLNHQGPPGKSEGDEGLWTAIENWFLDGAYYTTAERPEGEGQKCTAVQTTP